MLGALALAHALFAALAWGTTWDDSAITLAFAHTLGTTGRVALTPLSEPVEGFSTALWMLLHAGLARLGLGPPGLLAAAKLGALALNVLTLGLTYALARRVLDSRPLALAAAVAFGTLSVAWIESVNGMETPLLLALVLAALLTFDQPGWHRAAFVVATTLLMLVRWEGAWLLVPFVAERVWRSGWRGLFRPTHFVWLGVFVGATLVRWRLFGEWVPNTILAKRHLPYAVGLHGGGWLLARANPFVFLVLAFAPLAAGLAWAAGRGPRPLARRAVLTGALRATGTPPLRLLVLVVLAVAVFNLAIGQNWGPKNRMAYPALPLLAILGLHLWTRVRAAAPEPRRARLRTGLTVALALNAAVGLAWAAYAAQHEPITVDRVARFGAAVERLRLASGRERLVYAGADMGGLALLHGVRLRVLDLGLLCDPTLARTGLAAAPAYLFEHERPDVIETHWLWTTLGGLDRAPALRARYAVVFVDGLRFFVRRDLLRALPAHRLRAGRFDAEGHTSAYDRAHFAHAASLAEDFGLNRAFGRYWTFE